MNACAFRAKWLIATWAWLLVTSSLSAADLRTSRGMRTVHRPASYESDVIAVDVIAEQVVAEQVVAEQVVGLPGPPMADFCDDPNCTACGATPDCGCPTCGTGRGYYGGIEYLMWWRRGRSLPPLVTSSVAGTTQENAGILGLDSTSILFGDRRVGDDARPGGRLTLGRWFHGDDRIALEARLFALNDAVVQYDASSDDVPILARPFFNVVTDQQDALLVAFPGISQGSITVSSGSDVQGGDVYLRALRYRHPCGRLDLLGGYQFSRIDQDLRVFTSSTTISDGTVPEGTVTEFTDLFDTRNEFSGGLIGFQAEWYRCGWDMQLLTKVGLGNMRQRVVINGTSLITIPDEDPVQRGSGLLAQNSNIGTFRRDQFTAVPEVNFNLVRHLTPCIDLTFGYSYIHWGKVVQPGEQVDLNVNPTQGSDNPTGDLTRPEFPFRESSFWVQGLNAGLRARF